MIDRVKHNAGFTLAELLLSIAIIMVLAAIAIPSIVTAQNNMRMVELNNAAQSIANAAQTQMTAMKVSGTWLALIEDADGKVQYPASSTSTDTDTYYMVADSSGTLKGARDNGVVPGLSIDDTVRRGDFVIVFKASTASVVEVFYADGKTGFFGEAPESTNAAQSYYAGGSGNTAQATRMANNPMIGYYQGTPAGATDAVALENPVIWVDEETGRLMMQDPNISEDGTTGDTTSTIVFVNKTAGVQFVLSSLSKETTLMYVGLKVNDETDSGKTDDFSLSGIELKDVVEQVNRAGAGGGNVFAIDLNALSRKVTQTSSKAPDALKEAFNACKSDDDLDVRVTTTDTTRACVPAQASAHIKWPAPVGKLTLMVTNPYSAVVAASGDKDGGYVSADSYKEPTVRATADDRDDAKNGVISTSESEDVQNNLRDTFANTRIAQENKQSAYQSYAGGWVASSDVRDDETFRLEANVGSYGAHTYQIWELWIKRSDNGEAMRVGYLRNNAWEWAVFEQDGQKYNYEFLNQCLTWYAADGSKYDSITGVDTDATNIVAVAVNAQKLFASINDHADQHVVDEDGNASIYVRTAPKMSEVNTYFNSLAKSDSLITNFLSAEYDETSSRSAYSSSGSPTARKAFEGEFGASSSDVSWVVSRDRKTGFEQGDAFLGDETYTDVRVYYSISPGVGFANIRTYELNSAESYLTNVRSTSMTNVSLWLYRGLASQTLEAMTPAMLWQYDDTRYTCRQNGERYDFKLTTLEDYRFYRVLMYTGVQSGDVPSQYVPHIAVSDESVATFSRANGYEDEDYIYSLQHWTTGDTKTNEEGVKPTIEVSPNSIVANYPELAFQGTTLSVVYQKQKKGVGVIYAEFDNTQNIIGWVGYLSNSQTTRSDNSLAPDATAISSFGYYVVVPEGKIPTADSKDYRERSLIKEFEKVDLQGDGVFYDLYRIGGYSSSLPSGYGEMRISTKSVTYVCEGQSATYTFNLNFAAAVAKQGDSEVNFAKWGTADLPWIVRHALQFPGALPANNTSEGVVQAKYQSDYFVQSHSIDMASTIIANANKYEWTFRGSYNGNRYPIENLHDRFLSANSDITIKDASGVRAWGLFSATDGATIRNVRIIESNASEWSMKGTNGYSVGLLVGDARGGSIESCSVEGNNAVINIASSVRNGQTNCGGLVGKASNLEVKGSFVENLTIKLSAGGDWVNEPAMGGLVGYLWNAKVMSLDGNTMTAVSGVSLEITTGPSDKKTLRFGGIVGLAEDAGGETKISNCIAQKVDMNAPALEESVKKRVYFGTYAGSYVGTGDLIAGTKDPDEVRYRFGEDAYQSVTEPIGDAEPVTEGSSDES